MVETDSPYLAPEPYRGKRCEPAFVVETLKVLASVKGLPIEQVAAITVENSLRLFSGIK
jgi:TatD DNase family protein